MGLARLSYHYEYDPIARLLDLKLIGLWDETVVARFMRDAEQIRAGVVRAGHRDFAGRILIDLTDFAVQPSAITDSIANLLPLFGDRAGRVAVVNSASQLQKMQIQRLLSHEKVRMFPTRAEAKSWLEHPADP